MDIVGTEETVSVGNFYILGGDGEMPWAYERIYKLDMTDAANQLGMSATSNFNFQITVTRYDGTPLDVDFPAPVIIKRAPNSDFDELVLPLRVNNTLPLKVGQGACLRQACFVC